MRTWSAIGRAGLVIRSRCAVPASDERWVHRSLNAGDMDFDKGDLLGRLGALLAQERGRVAEAAGRAVENEQGVPVVRERDGIVGLVGCGHRGIRLRCQGSCWAARGYPYGSTTV